MSKKLNRCLVVLTIIVFCMTPMDGLQGGVRAQGEIPPALQPALSADGLTLYDGLPPMVVVADPSMAGKNLPASGPEAGGTPAGSRNTVSTWTITYMPAGSHDPWGATCQTFPAAAKSAIKAAAAIWAVILRSGVPITIQLCWSNIGSQSVLGYSGGEPQHMNFPGAPRANTWFTAALANSLAGYDLDASHFDDYITYNSGFDWYFGTTGTPPAGTYDLESVAAHEMGHGINIAGMASYSAGYGYWGYGGDPQIYDTFMEDGDGTHLTAYANGSVALGTLLTSNNLWFDGPDSYAANDSSRVKIYAPGSWSDGSSYLHLDYSTFVSTADNLMVYSIGPQNVRHSVGPVTRGMLKDMGWTLAVATEPISPSGPIETATPTFTWSKVDIATAYNLILYKGANLVYSKVVYPPACGTSTCLLTPTKGLTQGSYTWQISANEGGWTTSSGMSFTISLPFDSTFGSTTGWTPLNGKWSKSSGTYKSPGLPDMFVSSVHSGIYDNYTYEVRINRTGCINCANGLYINGSPSPLTVEGEWNSGYLFEVSNGGYWSLWRLDGGSEINYDPWTYAPDIVSSEWDILTVTYNSGTQMMQLFINYQLVSVWYMSSPTSGKVGITFYRDSTSAGNKFYVDYARLTGDAPASIVAGTSIGPDIIPKYESDVVPAVVGDPRKSP